ncbi:phosphoribosyltransferase [Parvibium lacunae]|uniref:Phosphoribosyltransferase n=1 Tax=Parvibium lacunae TaxID=1888893 RepID=A0A368L7M0_9BURK|nr:phosphoribosyltransferase [Parvibium lacunae]RCS59698.1 phosphoribosyltransferase [Parvibium lacunae]
MSDKRFVNWEEYYQLCEALACQIAASDWRFNHIVGIARGGLRAADVLSRVFKIPLAILVTSSYREDAGTAQGELQIATSLSMVAETLRGPVLLVDDLVDSGITLQATVPELLKRYPDITTCRTAVLWQKAQSVFAPDYCVQRLPDNPWIVQPFEHYDQLNIAQLQSDANLS